MKAKHTQQDLNQLELFPSDDKDTDNKIHTIPEDNNPQTVSLAYTPDDFRVPCDYKPPDEKEILLVIPCAGKKPYSSSRTYTMVTNRLQIALGEEQKRVHKITISGLYGPVPEEFEMVDAVTRYDFQLTPKNKVQIEQCATRLVDYLEKYSDNYTITIGYATSRAYRAILTLVEKRFPTFILLPQQLRQKRLAEFFRHTNLDALVEVIQDEL